MNIRQALKDLTAFVYEVEPTVRPGDVALVLNAIADYIETELNDTGTAEIPLLGTFRLTSQGVVFEPQDMSITEAQ